MRKRLILYIYIHKYICMYVFLLILFLHGTWVCSVFSQVFAVAKWTLVLWRSFPAPSVDLLCCYFFFSITASHLSPLAKAPAIVFATKPWFFSFSSSLLSLKDLFNALFQFQISIVTVHSVFRELLLRKSTYSIIFFTVYMKNQFLRAMVIYLLVQNEERIDHGNK